jgi:hypothetical protein
MEARSVRDNGAFAILLWGFLLAVANFAALWRISRLAKRTKEDVDDCRLACSQMLVEQGKPWLAEKMANEFLTHK